MTRKFRIFAVTGAGALALLLAGFASSAVAKDRNNDQIPDKWEKRFHLSLKVDQSDLDQDRDKVDNHNEFDEGTNPRDKDSDNDGKPDGKEDSDHDGLNNRGEDSTANQPDDRDTDDDATMDDDENAGVIASFDGTTLTINLAGGGQVSGQVTSQTEIECETEDEHEADDNSGPSENSGPGHASASHDGNEGSDHDDVDEPGEVEHGDDDNVCTTADLVPGAIVHEAELEGTVFREVELLK